MLGVRCVSLVCVSDIALRRWIGRLSGSRRQLFQEVQWQDLFNLGHDALHVLFRVGVEVVRVRPPNAERWEEAVEVLQVADRLACQNEVGTL